ncbi:hypothetical protein EDD15DRAFT_2232097 [Pisolithus albus]|nr:hypothetical protein EDD15DRAFT_2232097 [Pisolithus albus]
MTAVPVQHMLYTMLATVLVSFPFYGTSSSSTSSSPPCLAWIVSGSQGWPLQRGPTCIETYGLLRRIPIRVPPPPQLLRPVTCPNRVSCTLQISVELFHR